MISGIPLGLKTALESGDCVLFLGAGIGNHTLDPSGKAAPNGAALARELVAHFDIDTTVDNLAKISQVVEDRRGREALEEFIRKRFANLTPDTNLRWLLARRWQAIFTTNYDTAIERAYELNAKPVQRAVSISAINEIGAFDPRLDVPIFHLHGSITNRTGGIVITESDYVTYRDRRRMLFEYLNTKFATSTILYIGYSNQDSNWREVWTELIEEFLPSAPPLSYRIAPGTDSIDVEILKKKGLESIDSTFAEFCGIASAAVAESDSNVDFLASIRSQVPTQLLGLFEKNMAAVARLLSSWTYVNQAPFSEKPNLSAFLWGDRPNWSVVEKKQFFSRDIEDEIFEAILDQLTSSPGTPRTVLTLGAAGYGCTTVLMSLAVRLVAEGAKTVFMHRHGTPMTEGDIVFAASMGTQDHPTVIFVDDASDHLAPLQAAVGTLRATKQPAIFVLAERQNEWRQRRQSISAKEFAIESLSDQEIGRLLDFLAEHKALNKLESLPRDLQVMAIREKHGKELLVAMKEATEGKGFDAIIEDEYRSIASPLSRTIYLAVACSYQHGAYLRDGVLASMLGMGIDKLYEETKGTLDGVVLYDCIDEASGIYGARCRHRTIAQIVWERCGNPGERDAMLQQQISALNLNFRADVNAFEHFIRSDRMVDSIRTFDGKVQFFETACRKDPSSPYVRQHFARMLSREGKQELALAQIEEGFKIRANAPPRVLYHTKGMILTQLAVDTESESFARKRLVQAEEAFRRTLTINPKDAYGYQALARLFLLWAKRATSEAESAEYISKSEAVISEGLKIVKERDGLWTITADIEQWIGNESKRMKALEVAVRSSPESVVPRYLLGRGLRRSGQPEKALEVLKPVLSSHSDQYRSFIEYALALVDAGRPLAEAIATMGISTTYGLGDPRFVATLGGMQFLYGEHDNAAKTFQESVRREFPYEEAIAIHFRPKKDGVPLKLRGKVAVVRPNYVLIQVEGYPMFVCPKAKFGSAPMVKGVDVDFTLEFNAKGPTASWPVVLPK